MSLQGDVGELESAVIGDGELTYIVGIVQGYLEAAQSLASTFSSAFLWIL